jgi:hypothetical protein
VNAGPVLTASEIAQDVKRRLAEAASALVDQAVFGRMTGYVRVQADFVAGRLLCVVRRIENLASGP